MLTGRYAVVTLLSTDSYLAGSIVLGDTLRRHGWTHERIAFVTADVSARAREALRPWWDEVVQVETIDPPGKDVWKEYFLKNYTKLRIWQQTRFDKLLYIDSDTVVCGTLEKALERPRFAAAPCTLPPDTFNAGVLVVEPDEDVFRDMLEELPRRSEYQFGDQGFLNTYFSDWHSGPGTHRLPSVFNASHLLYYSRPGWERIREDLRILHFVGSRKPWRFRWGWPVRMFHRAGARTGRFASGMDPPTLWWRAWRDAIRYEPEAAAVAGLGAGFGWDP